MTPDARLVVVGTPIGNLADISARAVDALRAAAVIYCEDTRRTRALLSALGVPAPRLARLDAHTERAVAGRVADEVEGGAVVALVSDAGMPAISDPGAEVVKVVAGRGLTVDVVPGPSAVSAALAVSGLPASQYAFAGFLARKGQDRRRAVASIASSAVTTVVYEAANRVAATLADLAAACEPDRAVCVARELTKLHQEVWRGRLGSVDEWLSAGEPRGEFVLVIGPAPAVAPAEVSRSQIEAALVRLLEGGSESRSAVTEVAAELGVARRVVYDVAVSLKHERSAGSVAYPRPS